ncbi:GDSL esterase/lipase At5g45920-like [Chenopodium quinoa]|uniref:GDSL esterase/lipase At5g45920-like n=1 Tax=Chenopodium quinoa TaxID=63459 RepID=UPI000B78084B|nr:GDSL esterase/lipase At5g45920-like [Chenopodium quinoa]
MRPKIYLFGDSITEESFSNGGWGASLANHFSRTVDILMRGYSGYNTRWAVKVLDKVFPAADEAAPMAVTVFFGANDACLNDGYAAFQHVPLDEYKENLRNIFSFLKKKWETAIILFITPPPIDEAGRLLHPYIENPSGLPERTNEAAGSYAKACVDVARECATPVIDMWTKMQEFSDWKNSCLSDGLHLAQGGNRIVFEEVVKKLKEVGVSLELLPVDLPLFSEINPQDPLKAFEN